MKKLILGLAIITGTWTAFAAFQGYNGSTDLKLFDKLKCGTGMTCVRSARGVMEMISSPSTSEVGGFLITGAETTDAVLTMRSDESDDNGDDWKISATSASNDLQFLNDASGSQVAKLIVKNSTGNLLSAGTISSSGLISSGAVSATSLTLTGSIIGNKNLVTVLQTGSTLSATDCGGSFYNNVATTVNLPLASGVSGCAYTFITMNVNTLTINPNDSDQVLALTNTVGDSVYNAVVGNVVRLQSVPSTGWAPISVYGTWTDGN